RAPPAPRPRTVRPTAGARPGSPAAPGRAGRTVWWTFRALVADPPAGWWGERLRPGRRRPRGGGSPPRRRRPARGSAGRGRLRPRRGRSARSPPVPPARAAAPPRARAPPAAGPWATRG